MSSSAVDPTSSNSSAIGSAIASATGGQGLGQQAFLQLLTTQLSNQDPMDPTDDTQFLAQLAQFSTVEGIDNLQTTDAQTQAVSVIGHTVSANVVTNGVSTPVSGQVTGVSFDSQGNATLSVQNASSTSSATSAGNTISVPFSDVTSIQ
jgi:flagellar basal-body rod modification protein FlgD